VRARSRIQHRHAADYVCLSSRWLSGCGRWRVDHSARAALRRETASALVKASSTSGCSTADGSLAFDPKRRARRRQVCSLPSRIGPHLFLRRHCRIINPHTFDRRKFRRIKGFSRESSPCRPAGRRCTCGHNRYTSANNYCSRRRTNRMTFATVNFCFNQLQRSDSYVLLTIFCRTAEAAST
jgi:hypothetical protein